MRTRLILAASVLLFTSAIPAQQRLPRYYAHEAVADRHGVIAPWYRGQNGQLDLRVRIAAETLKRYPWVTGDAAPTPAPHYVYSGAWRISEAGEITVPPISDWANGDLGQRAAYVLLGLVDYYRYSGDPAAISHISLTADTILDHCQTPPDHDWPGFLVSVPTKGKPYGQADPHGFIQLDITAEVGLGLVRAYQLVGNERWIEAAKRWADLLAEKRSRTPGEPPWGRYANPDDVPWSDHMTGGVVFILEFLDTLIEMGYTGEDGAIVDARDAGRDTLRDELLPRWSENDVWGRNYWDWENPVQAENVTEFVARYLMEHPREFPNWRADARNIMTLFMHRACVSPASNGGVFSGAWAYPEGAGCCGRSLWYGPMELATVFAEYGVLADSDWAREHARRQQLLATYDVHETGVVEDNIDGGAIVAGAWFKIAHPMALRHVLATIAWLPETFAPPRENHIVRSSSTVSHVEYADGRVAYETFDARRPCIDVLRLSFMPESVTANKRPLRKRVDTSANGYTVQRLRGGDCILTVRHDARRRVLITGDDPQQEARVGRASSPSTAVTHTFTGNQVRLMGGVGPDGGLADLYVDGEKQLVPIDCWCPQRRERQVLYYRNGLPQGEHEVRVVPRGEGNPASSGADVRLDSVQWSSEEARAGFGSGGGPAGPQRVIFGYPRRTDYVDSAGHTWQPATEFVVRLAHMADAVADTWWTKPRLHGIAGASDPELYRYGAHAKDMTAYFTVAPGAYHARLLFAETRTTPPHQRSVSIAINGEPVATSLDIEATAGGSRRAVDLVFPDINPVDGVIAIRLHNEFGGEAMVQAIEISPEPLDGGAEPVSLAAMAAPTGNLLVNGGFEEGTLDTTGRMGETSSGYGWTYVFAAPSRCYIWGESAYSIHPTTGLPDIRTGKQALRTHTDSDGRTLVYQDVAVEPSADYRASVFVQTVDMRGHGFGAKPGDSAGLVIIELDAAGGVVMDHGKVAVTEAGNYAELAKEFTTGESAANIRFVLDARMGCNWNEGHVTYDDCELIRAGPGQS